MILDRKRYGLFSLFGIGLLGLAWLSFHGNLMAQTPAVDTAQLWKEVDDATNRGLPKTAIEKLKPLIDTALAAGDHDAAIKAISTKIVLESNIEGNQPGERITRMKAAIAAAPEPMKPVMNAIMANWFWNYFQQNRWQFDGRTQTETVPSDDFTTWSLPQLIGEVANQFELALGNPEPLQAASIAQFKEILEAGTPNATKYRPTLFDVLAHNAIDIYTAADTATAQPETPFELTAADPIFGTLEQFLAWDLSANESQSKLLRAVKLYQQLLRYHLKDEDRSALVDNDLLRLQFAHAAAVGEDKASAYRTALKRFIETNPDHEVAARALYELAQLAHGDNELVESRRIAQQAIERFPESPWVSSSHQLIATIEQPEATATAERVWAEPWPTINVRYRNTTKLHLKLIRFNYANFLTSNRWSALQLDQQTRKALIRQPAVKQWTIDLPETKDYRERIEKVPVPQDIPRGCYVLVASGDAKFNDDHYQLTLSEVWVSRLAIVTRVDQAHKRMEVWVSDSKTGNPVAGASVSLWQMNDQGVSHEAETLKTDKNGLCPIPTVTRRRMWVMVRHQGDSLVSGQAIDFQPYDAGDGSFERTQFFTDRAIYRPGQTIQYKGICYAGKPKDANYNTLARRELTVILRDVNGEEVERRQHRTNEFGSFSGSFTASRNRLMGQWSLQIEGGPEGWRQLQIEEYKRPKFRVEVAQPKSPAKLDQQVVVSGKATAYTGVAISDAKVTWRVVREVRYPIWWGWRCWWCPIESNRAEIAHGTATTGPDGSFEIAFTAKPDLSVSKESEPTFHYQVYADVTDTTGETRSDEQTIRLGYTAMKAELTADSWLTTDQPIDMTVVTRTLNDDPTAAKGTIKIYALKQPAEVIRPDLDPVRLYHHGGRVQPSDTTPDPSNPQSWELGELVHEQAFETQGDGKTVVQAALKAGIYRAELVSRDAFDAEIKAMLQLVVVDTEASKFAVRVPELLVIRKQTVAPGDTFEAVWGTGYDSARAWVEVVSDGKILQEFWSSPKSTQIRIKQAVDESLRGGFHLRVTMVRENRIYQQVHFIDVPWSNKDLKIRWERFVSKLSPGQAEKWTAIVEGPDAERAAAEMVATLYDASLNAFIDHSWINAFQGFRRDQSSIWATFSNLSNSIGVPFLPSRQPPGGIPFSYPQLLNRLIEDLQGYQRFQRFRGMAGGMGGGMPAPVAMSAMADSDGLAIMEKGALMNAVAAPKAAAAATANPPAKQLDLENVTARKNLQETAFFFPSLMADQDGTVRIDFTMPEALTEWKFMGFAHDPQLRAGYLSDTVVTSKDLMVQPNPPRFLREGDQVEFTVKVSNRSATRRAGTVRLSFKDARTDQAVDEALKLGERDQAFDLAVGESKSFGWRLVVPDDLGVLIYKAVGSSGRVSDGEEGYLPVLSRRVLVTESLSLPIRGQQTKQFELEKLIKSGESTTLKHQALTVQMVSNPSWYAVMAMPYLMEYPHQCSEQIFSRLYANSLGRHIVNSDPKIARVFEQWRGTETLDSPLNQNQDLKEALVEETPWLRDAKNESQARRDVANFFDANRLDSEEVQAASQLAQQQLDSGLWPWFPGGPGNEYITLHITSGFGRLSHLGVAVDLSPAYQSLSALDNWAKEMSDRITKDRDKAHIGCTIAMYLYGRSFFLDTNPIEDVNKAAVDYWLGQARKHWLTINSRQSQAHLAVALKRFGDRETPKAIMASIKERSVSNEEMGMFWRDLENRSWWWYDAPIESQAMMIEAFDEVMNDAESVEACKVWLLKQKQTQNWPTTKSTTDAIYALLLRGADMLASDELVQVMVGGEAVEPQDVEAGTGFYEQRYQRGEITPDSGKIQVTKVDDGVAWGSVHWQYLEDISKITPHAGNPLSLTKELYIKQNTASGPTLKKVTEAVAVGDELVVRLVLRVDRDMEYVHLKDHRGSGTEPVNVLSQYKYQDGLGYYESTRDTASHFFIDYLPKGTYVFEYSTRVQLRGEYQTGMANIQCMYAPEFNSHSESLGIEVK